MHNVVAFLATHWPWLVWPALTALFNALTRLDGMTWVMLEAKHPRLHAVLRLMRAVGIDPVVALKAIRDIVAARSEALGPMAWRGIEATPTPLPPPLVVAYDDNLTPAETPNAKKDILQ